MATICDDGRTGTGTCTGTGNPAPVTRHRSVPVVQGPALLTSYALGKESESESE